MSTRKRPFPRIPDRRLIILSGVSSHMPRAHAMANRKCEAVMASYMLVKSGNWWVEKVRPLFDTWAQYRFLDSGAFTFLKAGAGTRIKAPGRSSVRVTRGGNVSVAYHTGATAMEGGKETADDVDKRIADLKAHFQNYVAFLKENLDDWDFIVDMDVDTLNFGDVSGVEVTQRCRKTLLEIAGEKLLPVWHPIAGMSSFRDLCRDYPFVAIGSDMDPASRKLRQLCDYAHSQGVKVHGFGTSKVDVLEVTPFDTVDSTTWVSSVRFGQFAGWRFTSKDGKAKISAREMAKAHRFRIIVKKLGYDPEELLEEGCSQTTKYEVAIALFQQRQDAASKIPPPGREINYAPMFSE